MLALRRNFELTRADAAETIQTYKAMLNGLHDAVCETMGLGTNLLEGWPNGEWTTATLSATCREWRQDEANSVRLLELAWRDRQSDCNWLLDLSIGLDQAHITVAEVWTAEVPGRAIPYEDLPPLTHFLTKHQARNADGKAATQVLGLGLDRIEAFRDFIQSSTRQLPVVVLSPRTRSQEREIGNNLVTQVVGLAHVIRIHPEAQGLYSTLMSTHDCHTGAIRLYMPGYRTTDKQWLHPYWRQSVVQREVSREIMDRVARESVATDVSPVIADLRERRDEQLRQEAQDLRSQAHQEAHARLKAEHSIEEYERYFNDLTQDNDGLRVQNRKLTEERTALKDELRQQGDKIRQLNWRIDGMWHSDMEDGVEEPVVNAPRLLLSGQAQATYRSLGDDERGYWDKNLFPKLLDLAQREHQTVRVKSRNKSKPCFTYPRRRTAEGRRIIYYCEEHDTYVCEIFTSAQHDGDYESLRGRGADREDYNGFVDLKELVADVVR